MSNRYLVGLASAAGSFIGLIVGAAVGASMEKHGGPAKRIEGTSIGGLVGMAAGAFAGAALASPSQVPAIVVTNPPAPPAPAVTNPPSPPALPAPPTTTANDPVLTDTASVNSAKTNLATWWAYMVQQGQVTQNYQPVLNGNDPNFVAALTYFQQWANQNGSPQDFTGAGVPVTALPYTNGTLDQYTSQVLAFAATHLQAPTPTPTPGQSPSPPPVVSPPPPPPVVSPPVPVPNAPAPQV